MECSCCGTCCQKGPPGLHLQDVPLYRDGVLRRSSLLTLRKGEWVRDNVAGRIVTLSREMVRVRSASDSTACLMLQQGNHCLIYTRRPAECRALKCWDPRELQELYQRDRAERLDLIPSDSGLARIVREHEEAVSLPLVQELVQAVRRHGEKDCLDRLGGLLEADRRFRDLLRDRAGAGENELEFILGRPLEEYLASLGLEVEVTSRGISLRERKPEKAASLSSLG